MKLIELEHLEASLKRWPRYSNTFYFKILNAFVESKKPLTLQDTFFLVKQYLIAKDKKTFDRNDFEYEFFNTFRELEINTLCILTNVITFPLFEQLFKMDFNQANCLNHILRLLKESGLIDKVDLPKLINSNQDQALVNCIKTLFEHNLLNELTANLVIANPNPDTTNALIILEQRLKLPLHAVVASHPSPLKLVTGIEMLKHNNLLNYLDLVKNNSNVPHLMASAIYWLSSAKINPEFYLDILSLAQYPDEVAKILVDLKFIGMLNSETINELLTTLEMKKGIVIYERSLTAILRNSNSLTKEFYLLAKRHTDPQEFARAIELLKKQSLSTNHLNDLYKSKTPIALAKIILFLNEYKLLDKFTIDYVISRVNDLEQLEIAVSILKEDQKTEWNAKDFENILLAEKPMSVAKVIAALQEPESRELLRYTDKPAQLVEVIKNLKQINCYESLLPKLRDELIQQSTRRKQQQKEITDRNQHLFLFKQSKDEKPELLQTQSCPTLVYANFNI